MWNGHCEKTRNKKFVLGNLGGNLGSTKCTCMSCSPIVSLSDVNLSVGSRKFVGAQICCWGLNDGIKGAHFKCIISPLASVTVGSVAEASSQDGSLSTGNFLSGRWIFGSAVFEPAIYCEYASFKSGGWLASYLSI